MAHEIEYWERTPFDHGATCRCGWSPDPRKAYRTKQMVEDEVRKHEQMVERVNLHLGSRNPSLKSQHAYYEQMANDSNVSAADRELWRILADGLASRLGKPVSDEDQPQLFLLDTQE